VVYTTNIQNYRENGGGIYVFPATVYHFVVPMNKYLVAKNVVIGYCQATVILIVL
jgi:hypothetical protein